MLDRVVADPDWQRLPDGIKRVVIRNVVSDIRGVVSKQMLATYPDLLQGYVRERIGKRLGER